MVTFSFLIFNSVRTQRCQWWCKKRGISRGNGGVTRGRGGKRRGKGRRVLWQIGRTATLSALPSTAVGVIYKSFLAVLWDFATVSFSFCAGPSHTHTHMHAGVCKGGGRIMPPLEVAAKHLLTPKDDDEQQQRQQ